MNIQGIVCLLIPFLQYTEAQDRQKAPKLSGSTYSQKDKKKYMNTASHIETEIGTHL